MTANQRLLHALLKTFLTVNDVAEMAGVSVQAVCLWARIGKLKGLRLGGQTLFEPEEVNNFLRERELIPRSRRWVRDRKNKKPHGPESAGPADSV